MADTPNVPNYKETSVVGSSWVRAVSVDIRNPHGGTPFMQIGEEKIMVLEDGDKVTKPIGNLLVSFDYQNAKHVQLYTLLNELYIEARDLRDNPPVIPPVEP